MIIIDISIFMDILCMNYIIITMIAVLAISSISDAFAAQLSWDARTMEAAEKPKFTFQRTVTIDYSDGGIFADQLRGKNESVQLELADSSDLTLLVEQLNKKLEQSGSIARITDLRLDYFAELTGYESYASIEYNIILIPTISQFSAPASSKNVILDVSWRGIKTIEPIMVGDYDVTKPLSLLESKFPQIHQSMIGTQTESLLSETLIDASGIESLSITKWHSLFDPTAIIPGAEPYGFQGEVVTTFSMGTSDIFNRMENKLGETILDLDKKYVISTYEAADGATLFVPGYAHAGILAGYEIIEAGPKAPFGTTPPGDQGKFPIFVLYGMAGAAVAGACGFFWWSSKKAKKDTALGQTGIDPAHLRGVETSSASGGYKTNRGEAELIGESDHIKTESVYSRRVLPKGWS